jgi:hypothetical protein
MPVNAKFARYFVRWMTLFAVIAIAIGGLSSCARDSQTYKRVDQLVAELDVASAGTVLVKNYTDGGEPHVPAVAMFISGNSAFAHISASLKDHGYKLFATSNWSRDADGTTQYVTLKRYAPGSKIVYHGEEIRFPKGGVLFGVAESA